LVSVSADPSTEIAIALILATFVLGWLSWRFIETPFRTRQLCASPGSVLLLGMTSSLCLILAGGYIEIGHGFPRRFSSHVVEYAAGGKTSEAATLPLAITSYQDVLHDRLAQIGETSSNSSPSVLIWGDSHAQFAAPAFDAFLKSRHIAGRLAMHAGTPPVLDHYFVFRGVGLCEDSPQYNAAILENAVKHHFRHVVLIARWDSYYQELLSSHRPIKQTAGSAAIDNAFEAGLFSLIQRLREAEITPWLMLPVPTQDVVVPRALARSEMYGRDVNLVGRLATADPSPYTVPFDIEKLRAIGCRILDPIPDFLNPATGRFDVVRDGVVLYRDNNHLSDAGARKVLLPFLQREFNVE
jgi:hypothetical protein